MLIELSISNIAIIESLSVSFRDGLTVLTGETGAGKSIIIDAISLVMGERASLDIIRTGCDEAIVEALFDVSSLPKLINDLQKNGIETNDNELIIKRVLSRTGKNRIYINGSMATLTLLQNIAPRLINIYGQHESQTLLHAENQLLLLDAFAGCTALREEHARLFTEYRRIQASIESLEQQERENARRIDMLQFQITEIASADLKTGEDVQLEEQLKIAVSAEKRGTISNEAFDRLYNGEGAILGTLRNINKGIKDIANIDNSLEPLHTTLNEAYLQLEDAAITLRDYSSHIESDPSSLQAMEDRLDIISRLKKKYGESIDEILEFKKRLDEELEHIKGAEEQHNTLELQLLEYFTALQKIGSELTINRNNGAKKLELALMAEVQQLAMNNAFISVFFENYHEPRSTGLERVEILFSPNQGETARPLAKIASGGELSRLMLAFKQVLPESDVPTLVFDEVDTGISGATSELVGKKLKNVAASQQVLCITHLPQVACCASHHLLVEKAITNQRTTTSVKHLQQQERIQEIARLLAGETITSSAMNHAEEMLKQSHNYTEAA